MPASVVRTSVTRCTGMASTVAVSMLNWLADTSFVTTGRCAVTTVDPTSGTPDLDTLAARCGSATGMLTATLFELEMAQHVERLPGNRYQRLR